jgi:O-antigen/teichoic acid export membrane protein
MAAAGENAPGGVSKRVLLRALSAGTGKLSWDLGSRLLSFALSILVARRLGAEGFGTYAVYWYSAWMVSQATDLGLHLVSLRSLSRAFEPRLFWSAVVAKGVLTAAAVVATLLALGAGALSSRAPLLLLLLGAHLLSSWVEFLGVVLRSRRGIAREGLALSALRMGWLTAAAGVLFRSVDLEALAAALVFASLPALVLALALVAEIDLPIPGETEAKRLLKEALPLGVVSVMTLLYLRADLFIVSAISGASEAGLFQGAFRLFEATFVVSGGIAAGTFPLLAARIGEKGFESLARFVLGLLALAAAPLSLAFALAPGPVLAVVYGEEFAAAARPLSFLGVALAAVFANALTTHLLVASGRSRSLVVAIAIRLVVGIALDFALVPRWGASGAALAVLAAEGSLLFTSLAFSADILGLSLSSRAPRAEASPCS